MTPKRPTVPASGHFHTSSALSIGKLTTSGAVFVRVAVCAANCNHDVLNGSKGQTSGRTEMIIDRAIRVGIATTGMTERKRDQCPSPEQEPAERSL